jgi:phosphoglycerol transferase MdoB-like AlkP superfamily enzyme
LQPPATGRPRFSLQLPALCYRRDRMKSAIATDSVPSRRRDVLRIGVGLLATFVLAGLLVAWREPTWTWPPVEGAMPGLLGLIALNVVPLLVVYLLVIALTRRVLISMWISLLLLHALYAADAGKMHFLGTPLLPADLRLLGEPGPAIQILGEYLHFNALVIGAMVLGVAFTLALWRERAMATLRGASRAVLAAIAIVLGTTLAAGVAPWPSVYDADRLGFHPWALSESAGHAGLVNTLLLYQWQFAGGDIPKADRKAAATLLLAHADTLRQRLADSGSASDLPDIVVLQSESLFDPARLRGVPDGRWLPQYHRLARHALAGNMQAPTFGGGTIRTEFEVLTGAPLGSLGGIQYPWLELNRNLLPGLARVLAAHGYTTTAIHPNSAAFWNRARTFPALGFERFIDRSAFSDSDVVGLFIGDAALTDHILATLDEGAKENGAPQFLFAISMENHGPFDWRPGLDPKRLAALPMPDKLDAGGRLWLGNYLYLSGDADHELGRLADALAKRKRRTLLLFYGDHMPLLDPVYVELGFDDGRDAQEQPVPWLLIDPAHPQPVRLDTRSWLFPDLLLDAAGIRDAAYFDVIDSLRTELDLDRNPPDAATQAGIDALARLHLRGEFDAFVQATLGAGVARVPAGTATPPPQP